MIIMTRKEMDNAGPTLIKQVYVKSILTRSRIPGVDYSLNPYVGCEFGCLYCYADIMAKHTLHRERWGKFVDIKVNAPFLLDKELEKNKPGIVILSSATDPYQLVEKRYQLTRKCLEILIKYNERYSVSILTRSPLVLRDVDLFREFSDIKVGLSITTDNERIRRLFEPGTHSSLSRIATLKRLKSMGIKTYAFIGPMLPMDAKNLAHMLSGSVDSVYLDRLNYPKKVSKLYHKHHLKHFLDEAYFRKVLETFTHFFHKEGTLTTFANKSNNTIH